MKHEELLQINGPNGSKFPELFQDARMIGLLNYLRGKRPKSSAGDAHIVIRDAGRGEGWMECIEAIENAWRPTEKTATFTGQKYVSSHPENQP